MGWDDNGELRISDPPKGMALNIFVRRDARKHQGLEEH